VIVPLATNGGYVASAYAVFVVLLVVYLAVIGARMARTRRELTALGAEAEDEL
jgi:hypothetical protein